MPPFAFLATFKSPCRERRRSTRAARLLALLLTWLVTLTGLTPAHAQASGPQAVTDATDASRAHTEQVAVRLLADSRVVQPGQALTVGIQQDLAAHWHTYWRNPGDSGMATSVAWQLPSGWQAGDLQWPTPQRIAVGPVTNHGHEGRVTLLARLQVPPDQALGQRIELQAQVNWLVCKEVCIPQQATLRLPLDVAARSVPDTDATAALAQARRALPRPAGDGSWVARAWRDEQALFIGLPAHASQGRETHFFANTWGVSQHDAQQVRLSPSAGLSVLRVPHGESPVSEGAPLAGVLRIGDEGHEIQVTVQAAPPEWRTAAGAGIDIDIDLLGLGAALGLAFVGGLILNLMPCVFPVLSIKALSLLQHPERSTWQRAAHGGAYTAGVVLSFVALAAALLALQASGHEIGWGFQFQSPVFVLLLASLLFGVGLNLAGVFSFGHSLTGVGDQLATRDGLAGSFFTGVLATVVATPCTAPFMASAVGYALTQPPVVVVGVFTSLGLGLAAPYLLLSLWPALQRALPRPGAWMERFKQALAFPMFAAATWLIWVLAQQGGPNAVAIGLGGMLLIGLAAWIHGSAQVASLRWQKRGAWLASTVLLIGTGAAAWALQQLDAPASAATPVDAQVGAQATWQPFTQARFDALRAEGKPVFVNLTAAWCITCLVNERVALNQDSVQQALRAHGVTYLKGDWTNQNPEITRVLAQFGRSGVPLYLLFPANPSLPAVVLPQVLTPETVRLAIAELARAPSPRP